MYFGFPSMEEYLQKHVHYHHVLQDVDNSLEYTMHSLK